MVDLAINQHPEHIKQILSRVSDPEIPVLTVLDMGVVRAVDVQDKKVHIKITPTYSGCPAMDTIAADLIMAFEREGYVATVELILSPAWSTDWISQEGRNKLEAYGIAAPLDESSDKRVLFEEARLVKCTNCQSMNTRLVSQFGSTACKALFQCDDCLEPFDYFKCLK